MSSYSKQLGEQFAKEAGIGGMIGKGLSYLPKMLPSFGNVGQNVMRGIGAGANAASHATPVNFNPATMGGLFHSVGNQLSRGIGGTIGGISRGMAGTNIPGIKQLGQAGMGMAGPIGHAAPTLGMGMGIMNHFNQAPLNEAYNGIDMRDQYINQLLQQQQAHNGTIGNWLSQYV